MNPTTNTLGEFNVGLPGQYFDAESNYWYNVNRYYVAALGRYLQADPIGLGGGLNPYTYVNNNPVTWVDSTGRNAGVIGGELGAEGGFLVCGPACAVIGAGIGLGIGIWATTEAINQFNEAQDGSESTPNDCPKNPFKGEPGSTADNGRQGRRYGPDGYPETDVDTGHDHGAGDPHAHDWGRPADGGPPTAGNRGPGRPIGPGDPLPQGG
jgi:RHS repeat-associated protein